MLVKGDLGNFLTDTRSVIMGILFLERGIVFVFFPFLEKTAATSDMTIRFSIGDFQ